MSPAPLGSTLWRRRPVEQDGEWRGADVLFGVANEKPRAVWRHVVGAQIGRGERHLLDLEQLARSTKHDVGIPQRHRNGCQTARRGIDVEQLAGCSGPLRIDAASDRYRLPRPSGFGADVDLGSVRFVGRVGQPASVGRQLSLHFVRRRVQKRPRRAPGPRLSNQDVEAAFRAAGRGRRFLRP